MAGDFGPMVERLQFIRDAESDHHTMAAVCARYGISRQRRLCALRSLEVWRRPRGHAFNRDVAVHARFRSSRASRRRR